MELRLAAQTDRERVYELYQKCARQEKSCWNETYPALEHIDSDLDEAALYLWQSDVALCGAVSLIRTDDIEELELPFQAKHPCVLTRLCLSPERQGRGEGGALLQAAERQAVWLGYDGIHLLCDLNNVPARRLYEHGKYRALGSAALYGHQYDAYEKLLDTFKAE